MLSTNFGDFPSLIIITFCPRAPLFPNSGFLTHIYLKWFWLEGLIVWFQTTATVMLVPSVLGISTNIIMMVILISNQYDSRWYFMNRVKKIFHDLKIENSIPQTPCYLKKNHLNFFLSERMSGISWKIFAIMTIPKCIWVCILYCTVHSVICSSLHKLQTITKLWMSWIPKLGSKPPITLQKFLDYVQK